MHPQTTDYIASAPVPAELLTDVERAEAIERNFLNLYRRYTQQSQQRRNWHADTCVDWQSIRHDHADAVHTIVEGFFGVEQYTPDYVIPLLTLLRRCYGRSQWHIRWGAEEERHADLWRNTVLALGRRQESWIDSYTYSLREKDYRLPWESPLHMVFYQVIQERATQVSYQNLGLAASGRLARLATPTDETLSKVCRLIASDEAAHFHFFVEIARLLLYYDPETSIRAFVEVLHKFTMPARDIMPGYETFGQTLHDTGVFGRIIYFRDVIGPVLTALCLPPARVLLGMHEAGACWAAVNINALENKVRTLVERNRTHLQSAGLSHLFKSDWQPAWEMKELYEHNDQSSIFRIR